MIAALRGTVWRSGPGYIVVEVMGGVGYRVSVTDAVSLGLRLGAPIELQIHHVIREDAQELYGFADTDELEVFGHLISVSGVGPRTALAALNGTTAPVLRSAIVRGDLAVLRATAGIGPKTAQRLIIELKDKLADAGVVLPVIHEVDSELVDALGGLGYSTAQAKEAVGKLGDLTGLSLQDKIKSALRVVQ